ncbi:hypothetical protein [Owenweeksia hongkongensis]|uniref:hypothetical protein n=1 Tax=Owenweeksia hongkongensis TaxID=253245 RepID=UPI003A90319F
MYSAWSSNGVIYFSEAIRAQVFSFTKLRFKHQEYFAFKKLTLDSVQNDSILTLFQTISAYPASRYIKNWSKTVDGKLYQVEIFNKKVDYQLKTYSGIPSNFESCPEAKNLDLFFKFVERIILTTNKEDLSIIYDQFYVDYETGRFVPQLSKGEFKALKENSNLILKKAASNKR